jgi:hypothetical protein
MGILDEVPGLIEALKGEMTPKFLATRDPDGIPNVVPCISMTPAEDQPDTLFFGNFLLRKSIKNLETDPRIGVLVITEALQGWILKGDFIEFQRTGPYVDYQMSSSLLRYNAYTGVRNAGVIRVRSIEGRFAISRLQVAWNYLRARLRAFRDPRDPESQQVVEIPLAVQREFARMAAVKVLAWIGEDGYPYVRPALSLQPTDVHTMTAWLGNDDLLAPPYGATVAGNILTFEAISYQAKGLWQGAGKLGALYVQQIYAGGPPYPGTRVA